MMKTIQLLPVNLFKLFFCLLLLFFMLSCEEEINYPKLGYTKLVTVANTTFHATAEVVEKGDFEVVDHGFFYYIGTSSPGTYFPEENKISLGNVIAHDTFCATINPDEIQYYYENQKCFVCAYYTDKRGTIYGKYVSAPILRTQVNNVVPSAARVGDTISIVGANFNTDLSLNQVLFNNTNAVVTEVTENRIRVIVPEGIYTYSWSYYITIKVVSGAQSMELSSVFLLGASPTSFSPATATWNEPIYIYGSGLQNSIVYFDDIEANSYYNSSSSYISTYVPAAIERKYSKIYVKTGSLKTEVPGGYFRMEDMVVEPPVYLRYYPGQYVYFEGSGFNPFDSKNILCLGETCVEATGSYSTLNFTLPASIGAGLYQVMISNGLDTVRFEDEISIVKPVISEVSVNSGYPGFNVAISGANLILENESPSINLGPYSFSPVSKTSTEIVFAIPYITPGIYSLYAQYGSFSVNCLNSFEVLEPNITSIVPSSGVAGSSVVIEGNGLSSANYTEVYFGNIKADIMSISNSRINVKVPAGLTSGNWMVQVYLGYNRLSSEVFFTVP